MKILWFTHTPAMAESVINKKPVGGGWLKSLNKALQEREDIELAVAFQYNGKVTAPFKCEKTLFFPIPEKKSTKLSQYTRLCVRNITDNSKDIKKYLEIVDRYKPDLIHIHGTERSYGLINTMTDIPVLISIQGNCTVYSRKFFSGISLKESNKIKMHKKLMLNSYSLKYKLFKNKSIQEQEILSTTNYIMGRTAWDRRITTILAPTARYYHGDEVLRDLFYENEWKKEQNNTMFICTTISQNLYKGLETVVETLDLLLDKISDKFFWKIIGIDETDSIVDIVRHKFRKFTKVRNNIIFLGRLDEVNLVNELLFSDLYVHPSHIENSPNSICEAMILGLPVIATYAGGTGSLLTDNESGILVQDGDPYVLSGAIAELYHDRNKGLELGKNARQLALHRHNKERIVNNLVDIYRDIISNHYS